MATLERIKAAGLPMAVCTNKTTRLSTRLLDALDLSRFFAAVVGGDGPVRKPDPGHLRIVMDQLRSNAGNTLMVGNSMNDVAAAKAAGMKVVAVSFGYTTAPTALGADVLIDRFDELSAIIGLDR